MTVPVVVGISGGLARESRTTRLLELILERAAARGAGTSLVDLHREEIDWCDGRDPSTYSAPTLEAVDTVRAAGACVVGTPIYRASFSGRLKNFLDVAPGDLLAGKPTCLAATAGGPQHRLAIDYALAPLVTQLGALVVPPPLFATREDMPSGGLSADLAEQVDAAVGALLA
jgi:FMN reductase